MYVFLVIVLNAINAGKKLHVPPQSQFFSNITNITHPMRQRSTVQGGPKVGIQLLKYFLYALKLHECTLCYLLSSTNIVYFLDNNSNLNLH